MDAITFIIAETATADNDEAANDQEQEHALALALIWGGMEVACLERARLHNPSRLYLTRPQLLPNPRFYAPWQCLRASKSDRAYITTMGFDVPTFNAILAAGFGQWWYQTPILRGDVDANGHARLGGRSLDAEGALGLVLRYLNSTMQETSLQEIFALIPTTASRYITFGPRLLLRAPRSMPCAAIRWPRDSVEGTPSKFEYLNGLIQVRHPLLTGAFASIDGLNLPLQA